MIVYWTPEIYNLIILQFERPLANSLSHMNALQTEQSLPRSDKNLPHHVNILKSKHNNGNFEARLSEDRQLKPNLATKNNERQQIEEVLQHKKGIKNPPEQNSHLRNIIQGQEQYLQSKPFHKKYGTQNTNINQPNATPETKSQKELKDKKQGQFENKTRTKQSFNKRLNNNIIKDDDHPITKNEFRIKKVDTRSPKKIRDDLILQNEEEQKVQREILELHKSTRKALEESRDTYRLNFNRMQAYLPNQQKDNEPTATEEDIIAKLNELLREKKKSIAKIQHKVESNAYKQYLKDLPQDIDELGSSQEEDSVEELPEKAHRIENSIGSYSRNMPELKDKKFGLNARRTYDVFKDEPRSSRFIQKDEQNQTVQQQSRNDGQNRVTVNNKLKDFLLN